MKKLTFGILALMFVANGARAEGRNVRLELNEVPTSTSTNLNLKKIQIFKDGLVVLSIRSQALPVRPIIRNIGQLNAYQMDKIENLIDDAREGRIVTRRGGAACFVAPAFEDRLTADRGRVFLESGSICTTITRNTAPAADRLIKILVDLKSSVNKG